MANPRRRFPSRNRACRRACTIVAAVVGALAPTLARAQVEQPVAQLLAAGDEAWRAGKLDDAFARYQAVLRRDSTSARAIFRVATMLGWRNDFTRSESMFRVYLRLAPGDDDGRVGLARTLAWAGRYDQSLALCDSVLAANPKHRDAALLAAQTRAWSGNLRAAIDRYRGWLSAHPDDADARIALDRLKVALTPSFEPTISSSNDSDDNRSTTYQILADWPAPWQSRLVADGSYRVADLGTRHGTSASLRASSSFTPRNGQWTVHGELGATRLEGNDGLASPAPTRFEPLAAVRVSGRIGHRLSLGGSASRAAFDETAPLIQSGIATSTVGADGAVAILRQLTLGGDGSWTRLSGGSGPNSRVSASGTLRWSAWPFVSFAAGVRGFAYDHAALDGYFAPKGYLLAEASARLRLGRDLGWGLESELGLGNQTITAFDDSHAGRFAQRANASILYRPVPGTEWSLSGGFANAASPVTVSSANYRFYTISLRGRVPL